MILPVLPDIDQANEADPSKRKRDSISKYLMFKVMATQEDSKAKVEAFKDADVEAGDSDAVAPMKQGFEKKRPEADKE